MAGESMSMSMDQNRYILHYFEDEKEITIVAEEVTA